MNGVSNPTIPTGTQVLGCGWYQGASALHFCNIGKRQHEGIGSERSIPRLVWHGTSRRRRKLIHSGALGAMVLLIAAAASLTALSVLSVCSNGVFFATPTGTSTVTMLADSDPYATGSTTTTRTCGTNSSGATDPTATLCSQQTFQVSFRCSSHEKLPLALLGGTLTREFNLNAHRLKAGGFDCD
jgi:hypothetical protein